MYNQGGFVERPNAANPLYNHRLASNHTFPVKRWWSSEEALIEPFKMVCALNLNHLESTVILAVLAGGTQVNAHVILEAGVEPWEIC